MAYTKFTKYIPVTEEDYHTFKEHQRREFKHVGEELTRPNALQPLVAAENEKTHTIFDSKADPEMQEQRFAHLTSVINRLKRKVDEQQHRQSSVKFLPSLPLQPQKIGKREEALANALGGDVWNAKDELLVNGVAVPNSNKNELLNYGASNWTSKYKGKIPKGAEQLQKLMADSNVPLKLWGTKLRNQPAAAAAAAAVEETATPSSSTSVEGFAPAGKKRKLSNPPVTPARNKKLEDGLDILNSSQRFRKFMHEK
jgi:hypothetical protein